MCIRDRSKSKGNFFTIKDLIDRGQRPEAIRYLLAGSHYRKPLSFSFEGVEQASSALERVHGLVVRLDELAGPDEATAEARVESVAEEACRSSREAFDAALADDLNTPEALAAVHALVSRANSLLAEGAITPSGAARVRRELAAMDGVFGVLLPSRREDRLSAEEQALFDERQEARRQRDFPRADAARAALEGLGVAVEDTPKGPRWRRKR